jgi:putative NIF3 family GTP cyclohydrolase 1 type 2
VQAGSGDDLFEQARRSGADLYVTSDLRHHPASDALAWDDAPALIDIPHWAAEWLWLPVAERALSRALGDRALPSTVSTLCTDPWTAHF